MKVAFIVHEFPCLSETFILNQVTGLIDRGHKVDIFAGSLKSFTKIHEDVERYHLLEHTVYYNHPIPTNKYIRILKGLGYIAKYISTNPLAVFRSLNIFKYKRNALKLNLLFQIIPFLEKGPHDIVHCQYGLIGLTALRLKELGVIKGKLVTSFRGFDATQSLKVRSGIYDELFRNGDLFLPVCKAFRQVLIEEGCEKKKIVVHHSGIDCSKYPYTEQRHDKGKPVNVLTIARLVEKKGISYAIQAISSIISSGRQVIYNIIGDGELHADLEHLIEDLGVESAVHLLGWRSDNEVIYFLQSSHIVLAPSITAADGNQEGIPNALKMAMAMGLPVISTLHSGIPELVEDGVSGFLVPERDVNALSDRLIYLLDHPEICSDMGKKGRKKIQEEFDIDILNNQLVDLYRQLLNGKKFSDQ